MQNKTNNLFFRAVILILFIVATLSWINASEKTDTLLHINFLDVGQGDSIHIRKDDFDILIDGGPDQDVLTALGEKMPFYDKTIEYMILTHPHADHVTGLVDILDYYEVQNIIYTDTKFDSNIYDEFLGKIEKENSNIIIAKGYEKFDIEDLFYFEILWPDENISNIESANENNTSIVTKVTYGNISTLLMGDLENDAQSDLLNLYPEKLDADILKVAHHGSSNATNEIFTKLVSVEIAIISCGVDNKFDHPHQESLDILDSLNMKTFRTDQDGAISIFSDGINFWRE